MTEPDKIFNSLPNTNTNCGGALSLGQMICCFESPKRSCLNIRVGVPVSTCSAPSLIIMTVISKGESILETTGDPVSSKSQAYPEDHSQILGAFFEGEGKRDTEENVTLCPTEL
jgi:hypothetical protein